MKLQTCLFCAAWLFLPVSLGMAAPPNIVLLLSDDQAWTDYGFMGHPEIRTPRLDRLAAESVFFPRGYVTTSLCRPSLATLVTGLFPHQHRISGNDPAPPSDVPRRKLRSNPEYRQLCERLISHIDEVPTLPRMLKTAGYVSFQAGKWWEGHHSRGGFDAGMTHGDPARGGRHGDEGLKIGREGLQPIFDFIDGAGDKPFFVWYAPFLPHSPHNPPERLLEKYTQPGRPVELARYYAMCEWFDETCGELVDYVDKSPHAENTLVIYITDNGWIQRTSQSAVPEGWNQPFAPKSKRSPYDGGLRTPVLLRWKGKLEPAKYDTLVSSIDIAPTILAAAGISIPETLPGVNLLEIAEAKGRSSRDIIFGELFAHDIADIDRPAASLDYRWCLQGRWKVIDPADASQPTELYDVLDDPHETRNVASAYPDLAARLKQRIDAWWSPSE